MKQFLYIFSLYLLVLACLPCNDGRHASDALPTDGETISLNDDHGCPLRDSCCDLCSSFCICACCGSMIVSSKVSTLQLSLFTASLQRKGFSYQFFFSSADLSNLFRPPISPAA